MASNDPNRRVSETGLVDPAVAARLLSKDDKLTSKPKPKKPSAKTGHDDTSRQSKTRAQVTQMADQTTERKAAATSRSPSPDSSQINEGDGESKKNLPAGRASEEHVKCEHCKKSMDKSVHTSHVKICLQKKLERARKKKEAKEAKAKDAREKNGEKDKDGEIAGDDGETVIKSAKKSATKATLDGTPKKSKKRKADGEGEKEPKKKKAKKDEPPKPKIPKPKGPVDVEKQCGVPIANGFCARSLTCKSHPMGAKRSVPGRSLPYDMLLAQYQKKNQAKQQQKAAMDANAPLPDEADPAGPVDSDEEKDAVMMAVARSRPRPLAQHIHISTHRRYAHIRMKEMLTNALAGRGGPGGLFGISAAAAATSVAAGPSTDGTNKKHPEMTTGLEGIDGAQRQQAFTALSGGGGSIAGVQKGGASAGMIGGTTSRKSSIVSTGAAGAGITAGTGLV